VKDVSDVVASGALKVCCCICLRRETPHLSVDGSFTTTPGSKGTPWSVHRVSWRHNCGNSDRATQFSVLRRGFDDIVFPDPHFLGLRDHLMREKPATILTFGTYLDDFSHEFFGCLIRVKASGILEKLNFFQRKFLGTRVWYEAVRAKNLVSSNARNRLMIR
jgi:hypothetical protein